MVTIHVEDEDLWYHLPTFHATVGPLLLTNEASHEDMVKHKTEFTEAAYAIKRIAAPFIHTRCVEVMDGLPDHFRLAGYIPDFRVAENIIFDAFSITIMFIVRMSEITRKPTIQLKLLPEEFLGHLITTGNQSEGNSHYCQCIFMLSLNLTLYCAQTPFHNI
jgi:hypothetical protein